MYSYTPGLLKPDEEVPLPFFDEKTKLLFQSRGIPLEVSMKEYYSFVNAMVTLGMAFPNASGRSAKPKIRDCFNSDSQFVIKDYNIEQLTFDEMKSFQPEFLAFVNFVKYVKFLKTLKDRKLTVTDSVATTEISYVNNTIHLFNIMRGMTTGKIALETPNGTVCLDTIKTDEAVVEPLRNKVDDTSEMFDAVKNHIETIRKEYSEKERKLAEETKVQLQNIRATGFKESFNLMKQLVQSGFEVVQDGKHLVLTWNGKISVKSVTLNKSNITGQRTDEQITIPLPKEISDRLVITSVTLYVDEKMRISGARAKGRSPHLSSGSLCIGDLGGCDINAAPSVLHSLSTCNANSFGGGDGVGVVSDYIDDVRRAYKSGDSKRLEEMGITQTLESKGVEGDWGSVFGKIDPKKGGGEW
jgi:hypothetical protein